MIIHPSSSFPFTLPLLSIIIRIQMTHYRKYIKPQPFLDAQRALSRRLSRIEAQILQKFPSGEPRELMRRTIARLLQVEGTVQGKIRQLMAVVDRFQSIDSVTNDCTEEGGSVRPRNRSKDREGSSNVLGEGSMRRIRRSFEDPPANKPQSSGVQRFRTENYDASDEDYLSRTSYSSFVPSPSPSPSHPFSKMPMHASEEYGHPPHSPSGSASQLYESINEKDIFSFRTQKEQQSPSPLPKHSPKNEQSPKGMISMGRSKASDKKRPSNSRSKSKSKRSINYSSDNSPGKSRKSPIKRSPNKSNYDGVSQSFSPTLKQSQILSKTASQRLYQKIMNRLKFSSCVLGKVQHSGSIPAQGILQNRVRLQGEVRGSLRKDIVDLVQASSIWKY